MGRRLAIVLAALVASGAAQVQLAPARAQSTADIHKSITPPPSLDDRGSAFWRFFRDGEWYFSFGTSKQYWAPTNFHISQPSLGNDFTVHSVSGHDDSDAGAFLQGDLFGPQYNIRIGRFINDARTFAIELNFDHTKYTSTDGQTANVTGTIAGVPVNANHVLDANYFRYLLHNGANHLMANLVYRRPLLGELNETFSLAFIGKAGVGVMLPHADNTILGYSNNVGTKTPGNYIGIHNGWWQFGGVTTGAEAGFRFVAFKPVYFEVTDKVAYADMWNIPVYQGTASHSLWMNEVVFSIGFTYDGTPHH